MLGMDYGCPERKKPSLHGQKFTPTPKLLDTAEAYFRCHISPIFQISLISAFIHVRSPRCQVIWPCLQIYTIKTHFSIQKLRIRIRQFINGFFCHFHKNQPVSVSSSVVLNNASISSPIIGSNVSEGGLSSCLGPAEIMRLNQN